ncbi:hypothetical protein pb186bvf_005006 [Paramecium bursaria]
MIIYYFKETTYHFNVFQKIIFFPSSQGRNQLVLEKQQIIFLMTHQQKAARLHLTQPIKIALAVNQMDLDLFELEKEHFQFILEGVIKQKELLGKSIRSGSFKTQESCQTDRIKQKSILREKSNSKSKNLQVKFQYLNLYKNTQFYSKKSLKLSATFKKIVLELISSYQEGNSQINKIFQIKEVPHSQVVSEFIMFNIIIHLIRTLYSRVYGLKLIRNFLQIKLHRLIYFREL